MVVRSEKMNKYYLKQIKKHLPEIYKQYLLKYVDDKQLKTIFSNKRVAKAFANAINIFYKFGDCGNLKGFEIDTYLKIYENAIKIETGFQDIYFRHFLEMYKYYTTVMYHAVVDDTDKYMNEKETEYFKNISYVTIGATENVFLDLEHGNYWWEVDSASALRTQFMNDKIIMPEHILQGLCEKYLGRRIDFEKELHINENRTTPPMELVAELDKKMAARGYKVGYVWEEYYSQTKKVRVVSPSQPNNGKYYVKKYVEAKDLQR